KLHSGAGQVSVTIPLGMVSSSPFHLAVVGEKIPCLSASDYFNLHLSTLRCNTSWNGLSFSDRGRFYLFLTYRFQHRFHQTLSHQDGSFTYLLCSLARAS